MEPKNPIVIDGVDVNGCEYCLKMTKCRCTIQQDVYKCLCEDNPNCYYKQLKRKEKACKEWKEEYRAKVEELNELEEKLLHKERECEEFKKHVFGLRPELKSMIDKTCCKYNIKAKYYHDKIIEIMNNLDKYGQTFAEIIRFLKKDENFARYSGRLIIFAKPALEKIEKILKENNIKISEVLDAR